MPFQRSLGLVGISLFILCALGSVWAQAADGRVTKELPNQIGVYQVKLEGETTLSPGDIVTLSRNGEKIGEATVMRVNGTTAVVSLKGVYEAVSGDQIEFARSSRTPRAQQTRQEESVQTQPSSPPTSPPPARRPAPDAGPPSPGPSSSQQVCPSCKQGMRPTGKQKTERLKTLKQYTCGRHKYWVVTGNLGPQTRQTSPNQCPVCPFPLMLKGHKPGVGKVYKCQSGHEVVK